MTLEQIILYYEKAWHYKELESVVNWGIFGQALSNPEELENIISGKKKSGKVQGLEDFKKTHEGETKAGAWEYSA